MHNIATILLGYNIGFNIRKCQDQMRMVFGGIAPNFFLNRTISSLIFSTYLNNVYSQNLVLIVHLLPISQLNNFQSCTCFLFLC